MGQTIEGVVEIAKGVVSLVGGGATVIESGGLLWWVGVAEITIAETEIYTGITILSSAPDPTPGVNYIPDPNAPNTIKMDTVEIIITNTPETNVPDSIIYGEPPTGTAPQNIITMPTVEISSLPDNPIGGEGEGEEGEGEAVA